VGAGVAVAVKAGGMRLRAALRVSRGAAALAVLALIWTRLLADTVSFDVARAEGLRPEAARFIFMLLVAAVVALTMKVVGILLITALLIIPGAAARNFAATPEAMAVIAAGIGVIGVVGGLHGSLYFDTPAGPTIVVAALMLFLASMAMRGVIQWRASRVAEDHHAV
jgi:zinc transport system permease protein